MNLVIRTFTPELAKELSLLSDAAEVSPSEIDFNSDTSSLTIPMSRWEYAKTRGFLGLGERYKRISSDPVESELLVRDIIQYVPTIRIPLDTIDLLFGFKLDEQELYFCSAAESEGLPCFEARVKLRSYDIELRDCV